jgi:hypothetical protein
LEVDVIENERREALLYTELSPGRQSETLQRSGPVTEFFLNAVAVVVTALCYKPEGRGFDSL